MLTGAYMQRPAMGYMSSEQQKNYFPNSAQQKDQKQLLKLLL